MSTGQIVTMSVGAQALKAEIQESGLEILDEDRLGPYATQLALGRTSLWLIVRANGGGTALRCAYSPAGLQMVKRHGGVVELTSSTGDWRVQIGMDPKARVLRSCAAWTPNVDMLITEWPRDLYLLGEGDDLQRAVGNVEAAQRGTNAAVVYGRLHEPEFGSFLYFQNLTHLNAFFEATRTVPDGVVGGVWPELGYRPPYDEHWPVRALERIVWSDAVLALEPEAPRNPLDSAERFLRMLQRVLARIEWPEIEDHDWEARAKQTLADLKASDKVRQWVDGKLYIKPYVEGELPDSMTQLVVASAVATYAPSDPLVDELMEGMGAFFDESTSALKRFLPGLSGERDPNEVDSWYLYHPLLTLGRLARDGDAKAKDLFVRSIDAGIRAAHEFDYEWPVFFDLTTLEVKQCERKEGDPGQTDVGGLYAYVMLLAHEILGDDRYLREASRAVLKMRELRFDTTYQTNLTSWGAAACARLYAITGDSVFLGLCQSLLASFLHNCNLWESDIGTAKYFPTFMGASCLHNGPYMAIFECYESFVAFNELLDVAGDSLPAETRWLVQRYVEGAPHRAWFFYPRELPESAVSRTTISGAKDRDLTFPLEDLYPSGHPAGQVGQEVYGCGAAFVFAATRARRSKRR